MYVALFVCLLLQLVLWIGSLYPPLSWTFPFLFALLYVPLYYQNDREYNGKMQWKGFRSLFLWRWLSPVSYPEQPEHVGKLYVLVPGYTLASLVWGIGLHGGRMPRKLLYIVPPGIMYVPILREFLLWSGAISYHPTRRPLNDVLQKVIARGYSVCYSPALLHLNDEDLEAVAGLDGEMLGFARSSGVSIHAVAIHKEKERYHLLPLPRVQKFMFKHIMYPFPHIYLYRFLSNKKPPMLTLVVAPAVASASFATEQDHRNALADRFKSLCCQDLGDKTFKFY